GDDRRLLGAHPERVRGVLDVHARELPAVDGTHNRAHVVVRVRRIRLCRDRLRLLDELLAHENTWNTMSAASAPSRPPEATSSVESTPDSTRVWPTRKAMISAIDDTRNRCDAPAAYVTAIQHANAIAAWPDGSPPRNGVPRPVHALSAITTITVSTSATSVSSAGAWRNRSRRSAERSATLPAKTR